MEAQKRAAPQDEVAISTTQLWETVNDLQAELRSQDARWVQIEEVVSLMGMQRCTYSLDRGPCDISKQSFENGESSSLAVSGETAAPMLQVAEEVRQLRCDLREQQDEMQNLRAAVADMCNDLESLETAQAPLAQGLQTIIDQCTLVSLRDTALMDDSAPVLVQFRKDLEDVQTRQAEHFSRLLEEHRCRIDELFALKADAFEVQRLSEELSICRMEATSAKRIADSAREGGAAQDHSSVIAPSSLYAQSPQSSGRYIPGTTISLSLAPPLAEQHWRVPSPTRLQTPRQDSASFTSLRTPRQESSSTAVLGTFRQDSTSNCVHQPVGRMPSVLDTLATPREVSIAVQPRGASPIRTFPARRAMAQAPASVRHELRRAASQEPRGGRHQIYQTLQALPHVSLGARSSATALPGTAAIQPVNAQTPQPSPLQAQQAHERQRRGLSPLRSETVWVGKPSQSS